MAAGPPSPPVAPARFESMAEISGGFVGLFCSDEQKKMILRRALEPGYLEQGMVQARQAAGPQERDDPA